MTNKKYWVLTFLSAISIIVIKDSLGLPEIHWVKGLIVIFGFPLVQAFLFYGFEMSPKK